MVRIFGKKILSQNLLQIKFNEKIFVFFFFWLCLLLGLSMFSILLWMGRIQSRKWYFRKLLDIYVSWMSSKSRNVYKRFTRFQESECVANQSGQCRNVYQKTTFGEFEWSKRKHCAFRSYKNYLCFIYVILQSMARIPQNLPFGSSDLRVVLGLVQDQTGLIFCANIFHEICSSDINRKRMENSFPDSEWWIYKKINLSLPTKNEKSADKIISYVYLCILKLTFQIIAYPYYVFYILFGTYWQQFYKTKP